MKSVDIHEKYNMLISGTRDKEKSLLESSSNYLKSNASFNIFVNSIIYLILSFIEFTRYVVIGYSIFLVSRGDMEIGTILLVYSYYARMITNFEVLALINAEFQSVKVSLKRIRKISY